MKKLLQLFALAAIVMGCTKEEIITEDGLYTITGYTSVETKTDFGTPEVNSIPFVWSDGDKIWCGDKKSNAATNVNGASAEFTFSSEPSGNEIYYNMTGTSATTAVVPVIQDASKTLGENGDFGYGTLQDDSFTLNHATSYIWFNITSLPDGATLESICLNAGSNIIAGTATYNGTGFSTIEGSSTIDLKTNISSSTSGADAVMVVYPGTVSANAKLTYQFKIGNDTKYFEQILAECTLQSGHTYKITTDLSRVSLYQMRVLTFEDNDYKGSDPTPYWSGKIHIDPSAEGYGGGHGIISWYDEGNTELAYTPSETAIFPGMGGHAISNYYSTDLSIIVPGTLTPLDLYVYNESGANNSSNFASHFGYLDDSGWGMMDELIYFHFEDNTPRIIDHMYVCNTTYVVALLTNGDGWQVPNGATDATTYKIVAYGYNGSEQTGTAEFFLWKEGKVVVDEWTKWDLSSLGKVTRVEFNLIGSKDLYGQTGLGVAGYFAYDDVAVRFE